MSDKVVLRFRSDSAARANRVNALGVAGDEVRVRTLNCQMERFGDLGSEFGGDQGDEVRSVAQSLLKSRSKLASRYARFFAKSCLHTRTHRTALFGKLLSPRILDRLHFSTEALVDGEELLQFGWLIRCFGQRSNA